MNLNYDGMKSKEYQLDKDKILVNDQLTTKQVSL